MMQQGPWNRYGGAQPQTTQPAVIEGPPRLPAPQTADQARNDRLQADQRAADLTRADAERRRALAQAANEEAILARHGLTAEQFAAARAQYDSLGQLERGINEIDQLYRRDFRGRMTTAFGYLPDAMSARNQAFNNASNRLMSAIAAAQGLSAQQQNTPAELRIRFGPMLPTSGDTDESIEQKLANLRSLLGSQRENLTRQLGLENSQSQPTAAPPAPPHSSGGNGAPLEPGTDPNQLTVDVTGGREPGTVNEASPEILEAFANARRGNPNLPFEQFIASGQHRISSTPPNDGTDMLSRTVAAVTAAGINPAMALAALGGDRNILAGIRGAQDTVLLGTRDEITGAIRTLGGGTVDDNIARERGVDASDWENRYAARLGGEVAGGFALPMSRAARLGRTMLETGAYGAGYGFGSSEGGAIERGGNALVGGTVGLVTPPVLRGAGRTVNFLARPFRRAPAITDEGRELAQIAADENVPISRPIIDPAARNRMMVLESQVGGHGPVRESLNATQEGIEAGVDRLAGPGTANERGAMGERVQQAGRNWLSRSGRRIGAIYTRAANMARDVPVLAGTAVQRIDQHIAELSQNPNQNADVINYLRGVRGDLVDENGILRPKTVAALRDMRTNLRGNLDHASLTHTNAERIMSDVLDGATDDVNHFLGAANPEANRLYQQADRQWRERHREITQVVDRLIGRADNPVAGGTVMERVSSFAAGDVPRLRRVLAMLSPAERNDLRATIAARAGYRSPDEPFSLAQFVAWQRSIPESARREIFGADGARSLQNLTRLSRALMDTRGALNNSRSGGARNNAAFWQSAFAGFLPGGLAGLIAGSGMQGTAVAAGAAQLGMAGAMAGIRRLSARALMSSNMSRWLADASSRTTPAAIRTHIGLLGGIAARDPAIAQEVLGLRGALLRAANDNFRSTAGRAAASGEDDRE